MKKPLTWGGDEDSLRDAMGVYKKGENWYVDYYHRGHRKRKKIGPNKKLAQHVLHDIQTRIVKGEHLGILEEKRVLFEDFATEYLKFSEATKSRTTFERQDKVAMGSLKAFFAGRYLFEITTGDIEKYKVSRLKEVSPGMVNRQLACVKHMFTKAVEWGYVRSNPAKPVKQLKEPPGRLRYLAPEEIQRLLDHCAPHLKRIVITALNTGMRSAEILNLKWADVDLANDRIILKVTKNNRMRVVPINETLRAVFQEISGNVRGEYVFAHKDGKPFGSVKTAFNAALRRAKIEDFRFHDLRHTFGSHLVMQGIDIRTVQTLLGHQDIRLTMRYSHLSSEHVRGAVQKLDGLWTPCGHQKGDESIKDVAKP